ncbi:hypothetical protein CRUP_030854, partial [Coryphaenoides rupestris]
SDSAVEEVSPPELCVEEVWCGAEGPASIAELALEQRGVHFPLVQHHCLLASLLHAAMTFGLRVKPLSLFDSKYLLRVLTAWVQAIDESPASSEPSCPAPPPALPLPASGPRADWWPSVCLDLGVLLQVNPDILRRHLVCELYSQGLDPRAEE